MIAGVMYCSRATSGSSNVRTDWRVISSSLFLIGAPYDGIVHTIGAFRTRIFGLSTMYGFRSPTTDFGASSPWFN